MESVELTIYDRAELDQVMVALLQRRDRCTADEVTVIDDLVGRLNWDAAAAELEQEPCSR